LWRKFQRLKAEGGVWMDRDFFALFDLPRAYSLDLRELDARYRDIQTWVHPDKHAHLPEADRRASMQWATFANEAYLTLKNPLKRARYLLQLASHDVAMENNTAMSPEFLMEQMEWREAVADARADGEVGRLEELQARIRSEARNQYVELETDLDRTRDYPSAADKVRKLMFQEKLLHEIDDAIEAAEA